jgi:hypothetical protein
MEEAKGGHMLAYQLGLEVEAKSHAPFLKLGKWKPRKREDFVETESYTFSFKFKNLGSQPYPGGHAFVQVRWTSGQFVRWRIDVPALAAGDEDYARFDYGSTEHESEILSSGYGLFFCEKIHPSNTDLTSLDGRTRYKVGPGGNAIRSIKATTWNTIYAKYSMMVSASGLAIVALDKIIAALVWMRLGA